MRLTHTFSPVYDASSRILILGSFPSAASREAGFYYGHPRNRFFPVICALYGEELPADVMQKRMLLLSHGIALYDVAARCEIEGSADASMREVVPNDLSEIFAAAKIERVFTNGSVAHALYRRLLMESVGREDRRLPSTSPANAAYSLERLIAEWRVITE